jgi:hypothetical protein
MTRRSEHLGMFSPDMVVDEGKKIGYQEGCVIDLGKSQSESKFFERFRFGTMCLLNVCDLV